MAQRARRIAHAEEERWQWWRHSSVKLETSATTGDGEKREGQRDRERQRGRVELTRERQRGVGEGVISSTGRKIPHHEKKENSLGRASYKEDLGLLTFKRVRDY